MAEKKKIALLGAGTMGVGIAQMFAQAGHEVKLIYVYDDKVRARPYETTSCGTRACWTGRRSLPLWAGLPAPSPWRRGPPLPM